MPTITIERNKKYREVVEGKWPYDEPLPDTQAGFEEQSDHHEAAEAFVELMESAPEPSEPDDEMEPLSWDMVSVPKDPDLVAKMATYFDGADPTEPTDQLRAKFRLLDVDRMVNAQLAAREELREAGQYSLTADSSGNGTSPNASE